MKKLLFLFVVLLTSCGGGTGNSETAEVDLQAEAERYTEHVIVHDFYESGDYPGYCYFEIQKFNSMGSVTSNSFKVLKPCDYYRVGDTIQ